MSKGLEALEELQNEWEFDSNLPKGFVDTRVSIIEKELKALEIIFSKQVDITFIYECNSYDDYCDRIVAMCPKFEFECDRDEWFDSFMLTEDEWDLLRRLA